MTILTTSQIGSPELVAHVNAIRLLGKQTVANVIEIGRHLTECKRIVGHGGFGGFLHREFGWNERTARIFMQVRKMAAASKTANFADLDLPVSAFYLLAAPSTPEPVREEIITRADRGEKLKVEDVKGAIRGARPAKKKTTAHTATAAKTAIAAVASQAMPGTIGPMFDPPQLKETPQSWTVVAVAEDGKHYGSGARFQTKEEARAYMVHAHRPLWDYAINEIRIAPNQDNPNCSMDRFEKGRDKGKVRPSCRVLFAHGTCGNLGWGEIDANSSAVWDEFNAGRGNVCDDGIPDYLKRVAP